MTSRDVIRQYRDARRRSFILFIVAALIVVAVSVYSLSISRIDLSMAQVLGIIWDDITGDVPDRFDDYAAWWTHQVVVNDNVPRTIAGICVGAILSTCGAAMQSITRNPLTDPYTIGISSAALLGVTVAVVCQVSMVPFVVGDAAMMVNAFLFSLIPSVVIILISSFKRTGSTMMILVGIALMYVFNAITTLIKFNADDEDVAEIYEWSLGTLAGVEWSGVVLLIATAVCILVVMMLMADRINVVCTGDNPAMALGEDPVRVKVACFILMSMATAVAVCYTGTIGFVGLVGPHLARLFVGNDNRLLIPLSFILGAMMVVGSDCIVRMLPAVLPVGVVTALIGSPVFLYFLYRMRKGRCW